MKKEAPVALMIGGGILLLIIVLSVGYKLLNPPQVLREGGTGGPGMMQQRQPGTPTNGKPAMSAQPGVGDFTK